MKDSECLGLGLALYTPLATQSAGVRVRIGALPSTSKSEYTSRSIAMNPRKNNKYEALFLTI